METYPVWDRIITARFFSQVGKYITTNQWYAPTANADDLIKDEFYNPLTATVKIPQIMGTHGMGIRNN